MTYVCLWSPDWSIGEGPGPERAAALLEVAPRVVVERRGVVWADARGLPAARVAAVLVERAGGAGVWAGVAATPVAAEVAARVCAPAPGATGDGAASSVEPVAFGIRGRGSVAVVERDREFLAPLPLPLLGPEERLLALLEGVGVRCCGELAALEREGVEVRFGVEGVRLWRLARADDPRRLFGPIPRERPHASLDFIDYVVTDPERLVFTANALLGSVVGVLQSRGEHARRLRLMLALANGGSWRRTLRPARPTAGRETWLRLVRGALERLTVPDAVAGLSLEVEATEEAAARQGDLFDRGFATAAAVEAALARVVERQGEVVVEPENTGHPLLDRRTTWAPVSVLAAARPALPLPPAASPGEDPPGLVLQLLPEPRPIEVEAMDRRDHALPARYRDREGWKRVMTAAGPDRISGGRWDDPYAREYFRCVTEDGVLVWLYRDGRRGAWFLHGWWD